MSAIPVWAWWTLGVLAYAAFMVLTAWLTGRFVHISDDESEEMYYVALRSAFWPVGLPLVLICVAYGAGDDAYERVKASAEFTPGIPVVESEASE